MKTTSPFSSLFSQKAVFFFLMGLFGVLFLLPKYSFADTIHSTEQGGSWTQTTTWVEGVLPTENDDVEVNGYVYLPYLSEQHIRNLTITQGGTLSTRYSDHAGKIYTHNVHNNGTIKGLYIYIDENMENSGTIHSAILSLFGNITNNGTFVRPNSSQLSDIHFHGTNPKTIQGLENQDVTITLMDDLYVNSESLILPNLHTRDHIFHGNLYLHTGNSTSYYFNGALNFIIDGNLHFSGVFNSHTQHIQANTITLEHDTHVNLGSDNNHIYGITLLGMNSRIGATRYGEKIHFYDKVFAQENASIATSSGVFFYDDVDFYGTLDFGHKTVFIANDIPNKDHYFFEYILNGYQGNTDGEGNNYGWRISRVQDQDGNYIELKDILLDRTQSFQWRTKTNEDDWSEWHTFNQPLYLEENTHFFSTNISNTTENEEQTITITAEDSTYTGDISLSVDEGNVSPSIVHMENGTVTTTISFDTPQENTKLYLQSNNHSTLSGESNSFTVNHQIQYTFFTVPVIDNGEVEREMLVTLNASEQDYEGDVNITYHSIDGEGNDTTETLDNAHFSQEASVTFSFTPQETTQNAYFSFQDTNRDYLLGTSNHFYVIPKPHHHGGSVVSRKKLSQIFGNTFLSQGGGEQSSPPPEEENDEQEDLLGDEEAENPPADEQNEEQNEEETQEPNYLLENTCLNIHSIYQSLSKSRRTLLKSIPQEKQNVKNLQQKLKDLHFLNGYLDGDYGNQTKQAVSDFQEQNNLTPDGIFGHQSSNFIDTHCNHLNEKIIPDEEDEQNQNDETNNENNEQEEQVPADETTLWGEIWDIYSNPILYLINYADDIGGWVSGLFEINNINNIDQLNHPVLEDDENNEIIEVSDTIESDNILISFADGINQDVISVYTLNVLKDILVNSDNSYALITSTARTPERQVDAMIQNIKSNGIQSQYNLYSKYGDMVLDMYPNRQAMIDKIYEIGPQKVSKHLADFTKNNVIDILPSSIEHRKKFRMAVKNDSRVSKAFFPEEQGGENAYHLVIPQNQV